MWWLPLHVLVESFMLAGWRRAVDIASWDGSRLEFTDASVGLLSEQRQGLAPLSAPLVSERGGAQ